MASIGIWHRPAGWARLLRRARRFSRELLGQGADLLAPRLCALCELPLDADRLGLCEACLRELPGRDARRCTICALPLDETTSDDTPSEAARVARPACATALSCTECATRARPFDAGFALADYAPPLDRALVVGKFRGQWPLLRSLAQALATDMADLAPAPILVAVPLSIERLAERGYNQADIIAKSLSRELGWPRASHRLLRVRDTARQSALPRADREVNLRDAFRCRGRFDGQQIALVDDVMTTGATLDAAARALKDAGAVRVIVLVIARTKTRHYLSDRRAHRFDDD